MCGHTLQINQPNIQDISIRSIFNPEDLTHIYFSIHRVGHSAWNTSSKEAMPKFIQIIFTFFEILYIYTCSNFDMKSMCTHQLRYYNFSTFRRQTSINPRTNSLVAEPKNVAIHPRTNSLVAEPKNVAIHDRE